MNIHTERVGVRAYWTNVGVSVPQMNNGVQLPCEEPLLIRKCSFYLQLLPISLHRALERKKKQVERLEEQLMKLDVKATDKQENKEIALGTSKLNYLDPRISVAW